MIDEHYPPALKAVELAAVVERRQKNGLPQEAPLVGVALSGGGIRSATFCLGLFQSLARQRLASRIDLLSTVSGGGYFGGFFGAAFMRKDASAASVENELADNQSWPVRWLRDNGRFLSPNGAGDTCMAAASAFRNWVSLHVVLLTFCFMLLGLGQLFRADLFTFSLTTEWWTKWEKYLWANQALKIWWSPWLILPALSFVSIMVVSGSVYWLTQLTVLMKFFHGLVGFSSRAVRIMSLPEFIARAQARLTRVFMVGLFTTVVLFVCALIDSLGQTAYANWRAEDFHFWAAVTGAGAAVYGFGSKIFMFLEGLLGKRKFQAPFDLIVLVAALLWLLLILTGLAALVSAIAWKWQDVADEEGLHLMPGDWTLMLAVVIAFVLSVWFSRSFGFVNLSSMQQLYAARLRRAYVGATNPIRRRSKNYSMTELIPGDDLALDGYLPHRHGGPLHLINVTVNETISGKSQIEQRDRKGLALAVGPCGISVGTNSHALWSAAAQEPVRRRFLSGLFDDRTRAITPIVPPVMNDLHALHDPACHARSGGGESVRVQHIEALSLGRWVAVSGAAFTTGIGAGTRLGLSLLLGLANVRLGYWWDSGIDSRHHRQTTPPGFVELSARILSWLMPVQMCLLNEFFARFHGPARRFWYLSDGGHFENTACYELIRRRVPLIICSDAGQDPLYQFEDLANLVRKARIDFGAEIQIVRRGADRSKNDPSLPFPLPPLEQIVHPDLLDVIGSLEDFPALSEGSPGDNGAPAEKPAMARRHAVLARVRYLDTNAFSWLLMIKPSLMGDESMDVLQYQRAHPLFPQEPTSDQYFDEAQWESYRKLGEHIGNELFSPPADPAKGWSPSQFAPPV